MTARQKILKVVYPLLMAWNKLVGKKDKILERENSVQPLQSFYGLTVTLNNGDSISMAGYKGKKIMLVNTASDCGYTNQYDDLQKLYERYKNKLVIIGFPANDFHEQEKGSDEEIAQFCKKNYGVTFPLAKKSIVIKGPEQDMVFAWLSNKNKNGWNDQQPTWNFSKYLINEKGMLTCYFDPSVSPVSKNVIIAINQ